MVKREMYQDIQARKRQGIGISAIADTLNLDRKTVSKYYRMDEHSYAQYCRETAFREKGFDEHAGEILDLYATNEFRKLNIAAVYDYLEERLGPLEYSEQTLRNYVRYLQETNELEIHERIRRYEKVPELPFGQQMQMDFGMYRLENGLVLYIYSAVLSASRLKYMVFQDRPMRTLDVIHHTLDCFDYFGGVPRELVIDQDSLLVVSENHGDIVYTDAFGTFIEEMELSMYVCRKADPESKGKVENTIKYVKRNFLDIRTLSTLEEANERLSQWLTRRANGKISQATKRIPSELMEIEREHLRRCRNSIFRKDSRLYRQSRLVSENSYVSVDGSLYSVPTKYRKRRVDIYVTVDELFVFDSIDGTQLCRHHVARFTGSTISDQGHFRSREFSTQSLREKTAALFSLKLWHEFVKANYAWIPRYTRDQSLEALRRFSAEIDTHVLNQALRFCLDHNTLSFTDLKDTYDYLLRLEEPATSPPSLTTIELPTVPVTRRSIDSYRKIAGVSR